MLAVIQSGRVTFYRRMPNGLELWREIRGSEVLIKRALSAARDLFAQAANNGGWPTALEQGFSSLDSREPKEFSGPRRRIGVTTDLNGLGTEAE